MRPLVHVVALALLVADCAPPRAVEGPVEPKPAAVETVPTTAPGEASVSEASASGTPTAADPPAPAPRDVTSLLRPIRDKYGVPGMAGAIVAGGQVVALGVVGLRDRDKPVAVDVDDKWHLGSCTKSMTATLCAMLVEEGKLKFETTVGQAFADVADMDPGWRGATLDMLLRHHAGAPHDLDADGLWERLRAMTASPPQAQRRALVEGVLKRPPVAKPGTKYVYSNAGYAIAGAMAESVTKTPWETLIAQRLFKPLGMNSAGFGAPGVKGALDQPRGHDKDGKPFEPGPNADNPAAIGPAGTVHCTIGDWAKYVALHLRGERFDGVRRLLKKETFVRLHLPTTNESHYAMGWLVVPRPWAAGRALTHSGSNTMWFCTAWLAPDCDFAVLVTCNQGGDEASKAVDAACGALVRDHVAHAEDAK